MNLYQRAAAIAADAMDLSGDARRDHVTRACGTDAALQHEVQSLLDAHDRAGGFLETPPDTSVLATLAEPALSAGSTVGPYRIAELIGEGGMGVVYRAEDTRLGRDVALKAIVSPFAGDEQWRARLRREARAAAALAHPGVATVYALEEIDGRVFLVTEFVSGETLRERVGRGRLADADVRDIGRQLADALAAAHDRGIVHRDLKPENVMWTPGGTVKILDFGVAHLDVAGDTAAGTQLTQAGAIFGTPAYMSPEQQRGEAAGPAADIFALGVMLAELATGRHPFAGATPAATVARSLTAEPALPGISAPLAHVIRTCVAKSAHDRYRSAHELRAALDASARGGSPRPTGSAGAFWWWQFHQAAVSAFSIALAVTLWLFRDALPAIAGFGPTTLVLISIVAALAATTLRLHLWFTARVYTADAIGQHRRVMPWTRAADLLQAASVGMAAVRLPPAHPVATALLIASAVVLAILCLVIEPATARAAKLG
jgi:eukaryotic-like serine/threonine-protein kinase